jgi:hypothetical protein
MNVPKTARGKELDARMLAQDAERLLSKVVALLDQAAVQRFDEENTQEAGA